MKAYQIRRLLRWSHLVLGGFVGAYVYSPYHLDPLWTDLMRYVAIPILSLTGLMMWQQARLSRLITPRRPLNAKHT